MRYPSSVFATITATLTILPTSIPRAVFAGNFYIVGGAGNSQCWCESVVAPNGWNFFSVNFRPSQEEECTLVSVAFRIQGVPDDPALMRRFESLLPGGMIGDPFGEGATLQGRWTTFGDYPVGVIWLYVTTPLPQQVWSVEAHQGIAGFASPIAAFESAPDVWVAQAGHSTSIDNPSPQCEACPQLPRTEGCPFAVAPKTWSNMKRIYR